MRRRGEGEGREAVGAHCADARSADGVSRPVDLKRAPPAAFSGNCASARSSVELEQRPSVAAWMRRPEGDAARDAASNARSEGPRQRHDARALLLLVAVIGSATPAYALATRASRPQLPLQLAAHAVCVASWPLLVCEAAAWFASPPLRGPRLLSALLWTHACAVAGVTLLLSSDYAAELPAGTRPGAGVTQYFWGVHFLLTLLNWPFAQLTLRAAFAPDLLRQAAYVWAALAAERAQGTFGCASFAAVSLRASLSSLVAAAVLTVAFEPQPGSLALLATVETCPRPLRFLPTALAAAGASLRRRAFGGLALLDSQAVLVLALFNLSSPYVMRLVPIGERLSLPQARAPRNEPCTLP